MFGNAHVGHLRKLFETLVLKLESFEDEGERSLESTDVACSLLGVRKIRILAMLWLGHEYCRTDKCDSGGSTRRICSPLLSCILAGKSEITRF